jgi:hypothetical protein
MPETAFADKLTLDPLERDCPKIKQTNKKVSKLQKSMWSCPEGTYNSRGLSKEIRG